MSNPSLHPLMLLLRLACLVAFLADVTGETITLSDDKIEFKGKTSNGDYECDFELFAKVSTFIVFIPYS